MPTRTAFLSRCFRALATLLFANLLVGVAAALPPGGAGGGGGGHGGGGGGHFGGHSGGSGSKSGGHFGWLHPGHSNRNGRFGASSMADSSPFQSSSLWSSIAFSRSFSAPPTLLLSHPTAGFDKRALADSSNSFSGRPRGAVYFYHYSHPRRPFGRYLSSGCFFNGTTQVCFFAPLLPFCGFADAFYFGAGLGGGWIDSGDGADEVEQPEMDTIPPESDLSDYGAPGGSDSTRTEGLAGNSAAGKDQFMLVLKNGVRYGVSDYWVADGYLEYTISDGTRSQVPLESLDVEATVAQNAPRGMSFVLRTSPAQGRQ
jgi:hypothetical protein